MFNRNTFIAAIMLGLVVGGVIWALCIALRIVFYNPVDRTRLSDLPKEATDVERFEFSPLSSSDRSFATTLIEVPVIDRLSVELINTEYPANSKDIELKYELTAETRSALDPLKDEKLRRELIDLLNMKRNFEKDRISKGREIHDEFCAKADANLFKHRLFSSLASSTIISSKNNPNLYPLRQAEAKSAFYNSKKNDIAMELEKLDNLFRESVKHNLEIMSSDQDKTANEKIVAIRDYLLEKTDAIKMDIRSSNNEVES